jgi:hypothetical protein
VDPVPDPLLLIKCGSAGNRTRTSGSEDRISLHRGRLFSIFILHLIKQFKHSDDFMLVGLGHAVAWFVKALSYKPKSRGLDLC